MNKFKFGWIIKIVERTESGIQIEIADLGNGKQMIVATDTLRPIAKDTYRQAGYGPFDSTSGDDIKECTNHLITRLLDERDLHERDEK